MRVEAFLRHRAGLTPSATAVVAAQERLSYADLDRLSERLAGTLCVHGVGPGDRVALFMENIAEMAVAIFAGLKSGATVVPVNPGIKADGLTHVLTDCAPKALFYETKHTGLCEEAMETSKHAPLCIVARTGKTASGRTLAFEDCLDPDTPLPPLQNDDRGLAFLIYTSGSSGKPKGVMMGHRNVEAAAAMIADYLENDDRDVVLSTLPLSFTYGLYQLLVAVRTGGTLILEKNFAFPHRVLEKAHAEGVTGFPLVPTMAAMLADLSEFPAGRLPALRYITNAAAALPPVHIKTLRALFPQARLFSMYGLTECARATFLAPEDLDRRPGSVGKALPGTEAVVLEEDGTEAALDATGELVIRGPHVMQGYWNDTEATAHVLRDAPDGRGKRLHTGDLFKRDAAGFLYFVGRKDEVVKIRGEKVSPRQVDAVLATCPGVREALAFTTPDPIAGHRLAALVVRADPDLTERTIARHCKHRLPDAMMPKSFIFRAELPKTPNGKTSRRLAAMEAMRASCTT
ncbi:class I adenylate-forming enzyme family protein [uncultured Nitratireductor sp.]|uniref:class I adenylate-forming enzyme family protein n=1 Tax=uncultured Nitratireductor sp. TaxID=520953 RepID=UPI0025FD0E90|nr:class I adenylate-forming enzyme family protein [uncultured Nitratireductor sp.]